MTSTDQPHAGAFRPGDPRINRGGRPRKELAIAHILREIGKTRHSASGKTKLEALLRSIYDSALQGDLDAARLIFERTEGRVKHTVAVESGDDLASAARQMLLSHDPEADNRGPGRRPDVAAPRRPRRQ